jgi:hypothetical protein
MKLLRELNEAVKQRIMYAKHAWERSGAGAHDLKDGKKSKRAKQKQQLRKELKNY